MHHPKSTSHSLPALPPSPASSCSPSCAPLPGRNMTGTGGATSTGTAGTGKRREPAATPARPAPRPRAAAVTDAASAAFPRTGGTATGTAGTGAAGTGVGRQRSGPLRNGRHGRHGHRGRRRTGGTGGTTPPRGPTPAANGMNFPFPQNRELSRCVYPANYLNSDVTAAYAKFKTDTVTSNGANGFRRIQRTASDPANMYTPASSTVSEGIAYGMLSRSTWARRPDAVRRPVEVLAGAPEQQRPDELVRSAPTGTATPGMGAATDADEDIAFALVMADKQWGSAGSLNYLNLAKAQINNIWLHEVVDRSWPGPATAGGDRPLEEHQHLVLRAGVLPLVQGGRFRPRLGRVVKTVYDTILSPQHAGQRAKPATEHQQRPRAGVVHQQRRVSSAARPVQLPVRFVPHAVPHRARLVLVRRNARAGLPTEDQQLLQRHRRGQHRRRLRHERHRTAQFLTGTGAPTWHSSRRRSSARQASARWSAVLPAVPQRELQRAWRPCRLMVGGAYYDESWAVMSLLMMTGNFLDYTATQPAHSAPLARARSSAGGEGRLFLRPQYLKGWKRRPQTIRCARLHFGYGAPVPRRSLRSTLGSARGKSARSGAVLAVSGRVGCSAGRVKRAHLIVAPAASKLSARRPRTVPVPPPPNEPSGAVLVVGDGAGLHRLQRGDARADGVHVRAAVGDRRVAVDGQLARVDERAVLGHARSAGAGRSTGPSCRRSR